MEDKPMKPKITIVAAVARNGVIGNQNALPWYLPEDLRRFKALTTGKTVLMGKKTFDSIVARIGKPLPNRKNIVLSRQTDLQLPPEVVVVNDLESILNSDETEIMVIGGGQLYNQLFDQADKMHLTHVLEDIEGDVKFPEIDWSQWKKTFEEPHGKFTFADYERI